MKLCFNHGSFLDVKAALQLIFNLTPTPFQIKKYFLNLFSTIAIDLL